MFNHLYCKRVYRGLTQQELATLSGVSRRTICRIEGGGMPTFKVAAKLCHVLNVSLEEVFPVDVLL